MGEFNFLPLRDNQFIVSCYRTMKLLTFPFLFASAAAGLILGWQLKTWVDSGEPVSSEGSGCEASRRVTVGSEGTGWDSMSSQQSADTAMALHALPTGALYDRMALFLLEAKAEDFPAFYEEFQKRSDRSHDLNELLFIAWTRVDPEAAITASRGTDDFKYAYWAWACHDPGAALAAALARNEGMMNVTRGIGEFHPTWLKEHWNLIPEDQRRNAIEGLAKWPDSETPEITLRLLAKMGLSSYFNLSEETILALTRQDPAHAYDVIKELLGDPGSYGSRKMIDSFIASLSRYEPELLGEIAAVTKSPVYKNEIQLAQFKSLLRENSEAAKAIIESTPKGWLKEDFAIMYANHLLSADPERGFEYAVNFLKNEFTTSERFTEIKWERITVRNGTSDAGSGELINSLIRRDAPALLNGLLPDSPSNGGGEALRTASEGWASQDFEAYVNWLGGHQDNSAIYEGGVSTIVNVLKNQGEFEAGMEWMESISRGEEKTNFQMSDLYRNWVSSNPEAATAWRLSDRFKGNPENFPLPKTTEQE